MISGATFACCNCLCCLACGSGQPICFRSISLTFKILQFAATSSSWGKESEEGESKRKVDRQCETCRLGAPEACNSQFASYRLPPRPPPTLGLSDAGVCRHSRSGGFTDGGRLPIRQGPGPVPSMNRLPRRGSNRLRLAARDRAEPRRDN